MNAGIARRRLLNQCITRPCQRRASDVVAWLGAVQAQEYEAAKWALGLRMRDGAADGEIQRAFDEGRILRTHVLRPTWHFVTPADIRWLLELTASRVYRAMSPSFRREELDTRALVRGTRAFERALRDGQHMTRGELAERAGLAMAGERLGLLAMYAELEGVICSGPRRGKQMTYALLAERAPGAKRLSRDEALAELCRRYFRSHGPATVRDFVWWSGLTGADARRGLEMNRARREELDGQIYWTVGPTPASPARMDLVQLLPIYDEYVIAYLDRQAVPHGPPVLTSASRGPVTFQHAVVIAGQIAGTWRPSRKSRAVSVEVTALRRLTSAERRALDHAIDRYGRFLGASVESSVGQAVRKSQTS
jgi:DNA glycosylase AlkZ-like